MALNDTELKEYQKGLLADFAAYLTRTRALQSPARAFEESTVAAFGHRLPYRPLPGAVNTPYVCLRVPTGGGKTRLAGRAIAAVRGNFMATNTPLVLWLVPSDPIRTQTLHVLKTAGELLHEDMRECFGGATVLTVNDALYLTPATLNSGVTIIVATMQSFKRETQDGLRVYRQNGALMDHFTHVPAHLHGERSLADVIRLRRPFVIVDEAHNQGTPLAVDTLARFNPACVLELTATPDRANNPSNVLRSVSAAVLQDEEMLKLPLELATNPGWQATLTDAIARLGELEKAAQEEARETGERIAPVMLIQAERKAADKETFTPERVKQHLIDDFQIRPADIAIATGAVDELGDKKTGAADYPRYIITVDKLREGWDCPDAYVLFSFRNSTSATAVEQVLGRILRMPHVTRKQREKLNRSYAFVVSDSFATIAGSLRDGLVQNGFERLDTSALIQPRSDERDLFSPAADVVIPLPEEDSAPDTERGSGTGTALVLPDATAVAALPKGLRDRLEVSPETGTLTIKGGATAKETRQIAETFKQPEVVKQVRDRLDFSIERQRHDTPLLSPAECGEKASIPLLGYRQSGFFDVFNETMLLDADWEIDSFDACLTEKEFDRDADAMRRGLLLISRQDEKVHQDPCERLDAQLALFSLRGGQDAEGDLVGWLDANLPFPYADRGQKVAWVNAAVTHLLQARGFSLEELRYRQFRLRGALERKLVSGLTLAKQRVMEGLFADESGFEVSDEHALTFEQGHYAYDTLYTGLTHLPRHFFPVIGNLKDNGEEFLCADYIANTLPNVKWWVRNIERKPSSFWLQTASDRFYPDFVVRMAAGPVEWLVVEYKGAHLSVKDNADSQEKKRLGELWARRSGGRCRFAWVEEKRWKATIEAALA
jgi:type III restriction enzyme